MKIKIVNDTTDNNHYGHIIGKVFDVHCIVEDKKKYQVGYLDRMYFINFSDAEVLSEEEEGGLFMDQYMKDRKKLFLSDIQMRAEIIRKEKERREKLGIEDPYTEAKRVCNDDMVDAYAYALRATSQKKGREVDSQNANGLPARRSIEGWWSVPLDSILLCK